MDDLRRREFITEPGESMLLARSSLEVALRYGMWQRFTQLPAEAIISNPIAATPLVQYPANGHPAQVWQQVNPACLWHPLMWLPDRLSGRYQIQQPDGTITREDDDTWAVRVCLELSASGMYDTESATWLDVLSMHGLDLDDPEVFDRVRWWQSGQTDPILDTIDLSPHIDTDDRHWALHTALEMMDDLRPASFALLANDLLATIDEIADPGNPALDTNPAATHQAAGTIIILGQTLLSKTAVGLTEGFWAEQNRALTVLDPDDYAGVLDGPIAAIGSAMYEVRDVHWPHLDALEGAGREPEPVYAS